jgi:hypothetical protein
MLQKQFRGFRLQLVHQGIDVTNAEEGRIV